MYRRWGKRLLDVCIAGVGLVLVAPLLVIACIAVCVSLRAKPIFFQPRAGLGGRSFTILKLKTMRDQPHDRLLSDEERSTWLGSLLRAASIDELPQLWNVLMGDMSIVGPRPLLLEYVPLYSSTQRRRLEVRPGLTGLAQVKGRNLLSWEEKFLLDVEYVDRLSLPMDIEILTRTIALLLRPRGILTETSGAMPRFTGSQESNS